jgi:uncharacterized OB-fold protein
VSTATTEPAITPDGWWSAAADHRLMLLRCPVCSTAWVPWMPHCPECGPGTDPVAIESSGRGTIYSWVGVVNSVSSPEDTPFTVLSVMLREGAMIYGRLAAEPGVEPSAEGEVVAVFVDRGDQTVIDFRPA